MENTPISWKTAATVFIVLGIAFVGYKYIASGIDETRQKNVLQEKQRLEELSRKPLDDCLLAVENRTKYNLELNSRLFLESNQPGWVEQCRATNAAFDQTRAGQGLPPRTPNGNECKPVTLTEIEAAKIQRQQEAELERQQCYKQYK